jgi:hypothetical protein
MGSPQVPFDVNDWEDQQVLEKVAKEKIAYDLLQQQAKQMEMQKDFQDGWNQALKEAGLTQAEYNELFEKDGEAGKKALTKGMKKAAQKAAQLKARRSQQQPGARQPAGNPDARKQTLQQIKAERGHTDDKMDKMLDVLLEGFR